MPGSRTRKYMTAETLIETLSRDMTSCGGTSIVPTRRSIFCMRSTNGMMKKRPGPRAPEKRPSRKITPRSYSWTTRTAEPRIGRTTKITTAIRMPRLISVCTEPSLFDDQRETPHVVDAHCRAARDDPDRGVRELGPPELALDADLPGRREVVGHRRDLADQPLFAGNR